MHFGSYLWLGVKGLLIIAGILLSLTGVGAPIGTPFTTFVTLTMFRNGKFVGFVTLIKATLFTVLFLAALLLLMFGVLHLLSAY